MKKHLALLLAACLLLCFAACGQDAAPAWEAGTVQDGTYTNAALGMTFQIPEGWIQASEEEKLTILGATGGDTRTVYDVLLGTQNNEAMMYVMCLDLTGQIGGTSMTMDEFLEQTAGEIAADPSMDSMQYSFSDHADAQLCGQTYRYMDITTAAGRCQRLLVLRLSGKKLVVVGLAGRTVDELDYYAAHFTGDPSGIPEPPVLPVLSTGRSYSRGRVDSGIYSSDYLNLSFAAPEGWSFASQAELAEQMGLSLDWLGDDIYGDNAELAKQIAQQATIYEMFATSPDSLSNVQIVLENLSASIGTSNMTEADYVAVLEQQLAAITEFTYEIEESYTSELAGYSFTVLPASIPEFEMQQAFCLLRIDEYMLCITFNSTADDLSGLEACFSPART